MVAFDSMTSFGSTVVTRDCNFPEAGMHSATSVYSGNAFQCWRGVLHEVKQFI